jgi:SulP family sulfate permease
MVALAMLGMFVYALFGTSRQLAVTSTSSSAAMLAALVAPIAPGGSAKYALLVSAATVAGGVIFLVGGVLKLGAVSEFISKPVLKGFVFGLALTIMVKQAHKLAGVSAGRGNFFHQAWNVLSLLRDVNPWTLAVGAAAIGIMFLLGSVAPRAIRISGPGIGDPGGLRARAERTSRGGGWQDSGGNAFVEPTQNW